MVPCVGSDADFFVLDLDREWIVDAQDMHYVNKYTPFARVRLKGYVEQTLVRGHLVCAEN